jgi:hypothetical protein
MGHIVPVYENIHWMYKTHSMGKHAITGNPFGPQDDYELSWAVEWLSQRVWDLYKSFPEFFPGFDKVSEALRDMAIELQIGPPRELYHTMPRLPFV